MASDNLNTWFSRNKGKGWVDCKTGETCGRKSAKKSKRGYPACRPTMAQCTDAAKKKTGPKRISWKNDRIKKASGGLICSRTAKGCGKVMNNRRKLTKFY